MTREAKMEGAPTEEGVSSSSPGDVYGKHLEWVTTLTQDTDNDSIRRKMRALDLMLDMIVIAAINTNEEYGEHKAYFKEIQDLAIETHQDTDNTEDSLLHSRDVNTWDIINAMVFMLYMILIKELVKQGYDEPPADEFNTDSKSFQKIYSIHFVNEVTRLFLEEWGTVRDGDHYQQVKKRFLTPPDGARSV